MARKITPERREQRKRLLALLQDAGVNDVEGVQELFKEMVGAVLENGLEGELDEELGYSKYDYRNKKTDNSRNGYSEKTLKTILGDLEGTVKKISQI
jgi:putative transposase